MWLHSTTKSKMGVMTIRDSRIQAAIRVVWLTLTRGIPRNKTSSHGINHVIPRSETDIRGINHGILISEIGSLLNSYLSCISRSVLGQVNKSLIKIITKESWPLNWSPDLSQFTDPTALKWREGQVPLKKGPDILPKIYTNNLFPVFPTKGLTAFCLCNCTLGKKEIIRPFREYWTWLSH